MTGCMESSSEKQRLAVVARCGNRCEAEVQLPFLSYEGEQIWARCFRLGVEVHHMLTRARGGDLLDLAGEDYHLAGVCPQHHRSAHGAGGRIAEMIIDGYVILDSATGQIVYVGPDEYLLETYGQKEAA